MEPFPFPFPDDIGVAPKKSAGAAKETGVYPTGRLKELPFMTSALKGEGGGGPGKADKVREFSKVGCVKITDRGGGSQKNQKILRTS